MVQEYVPVPEEMFPTVQDGHVQMRLKRFNINPFGIGGRYAGMITRISDQAVINVSAGGGLLPSVVGRHRQRLLAEEESTDDETAGATTLTTTPSLLHDFHVLREHVHLRRAGCRLSRAGRAIRHRRRRARRRPSVTKIRRRLRELRHPAEYLGSPSPDLERLVDCMVERNPVRIRRGRLRRGEAGPAAGDVASPLAARPHRRRAVAPPPHPARRRARRPRAELGDGVRARPRRRPWPAPIRRAASRAAAHPAAARGAGARRLRRGDRARRPLPDARPVCERRRERCADRGGGTAASSMG